MFGALIIFALIFLPLTAFYGFTASSRWARSYRGNLIEPFCRMLGIHKRRLMGSAGPKIYTDSELSSLIVVGMSAAEVAKKFGRPTIQTSIDQHTDFLLYSFPLTHVKDPLRVAAVSIFIKDESVTKWSSVREQL